MAPAVGICAQRITAGLEHDGPCHRVLGGDLDVAPGPGGRQVRTSIHRSGSLAEPRELVEVAAEPVDREELAVLGGIGAEWIGRGGEEHSPPIRAQEPSPGIDTPEVRELQQVLAVEEEDLEDRERKVGDRIHRGAGQVEREEFRPTARDLEARNDPAARERHGDRDRLEAGAVGVDGEEGAAGMEAVGVRLGEEHDRVVVAEAGEPREGNPGVDLARGGELRHLAAVSRGEIQRHDLDGVFACRAGSTVGVDDGSTVRAEAQGPARRVELDAARESGIHEHSPGAVATRGAEAAQSSAVGADVEDALLLRYRREARDEHLVVRYLEDQARSIRARPQPLKVAEAHGPATMSNLSKDSAEKPGILRPLPKGELQHGYGGTVSPPESEGLAEHGTPGIAAALVHYVGERPDAGAQRGAGAPLGAGPPAVASCCPTARARPLAGAQLLRAGTVARCRRSRA